VRGCAPAVALLVCAIAILAACSKGRGPASDPNVSPKSGAIPRPANDLRELVKPDSRIYPFSVVPGGVRDGVDVAAVRASDPVVRTHYKGIGLNLAPRTLVRDQWFYASYRIGRSVYWTRQKLRVRAGETILTDGVRLIRGRCGNRLSSNPKEPTRFIDPPSVLEDRPLQAMDYAAPEIASSKMPMDGDTFDLSVGLPADDSDQSRVGDPNLAGDREDRAPALPASHPAVLYPYAAEPSHLNAPEPGAWLMMLGGLGGIIAARRRR
jgi:hypothetical protein